MHLRALFDFVAEEAGELSIRAGDTLMLAEAGDFDSSDGWIQVLHNDGQGGLVPRDYLEPLATSDPHSTSAFPPSQAKYLRDDSRASSPNSVGSSRSDRDDAYTIEDGVDDFYNSAGQKVGGGVMWGIDAARGEEEGFGFTEPQPVTVLSAALEGQVDSPGRGAAVASLYDLAAETSVYGDDVFEQNTLFVKASGRSDESAGAEVHDSSAVHAIAADSFLVMTATRTGTNGTTVGSALNAAGLVSELYPLPGRDSSIDLGGVEPIFSSAAARGDFAELSRRAQEYCEQASAQSAADSTKLLSKLDVLSVKLNDALKASSVLLDNTRDLSDVLDAEKGRQAAFAKAQRTAHVLERSAKIMASE